MLALTYHSPQLSIYKIEEDKSSLLNQYIVSTSETREICNDPQICGIEYIQKLQKACLYILESLHVFSSIKLKEEQVLVLSMIDTGINFGIREMLAKAYQWNIHRNLYLNVNHNPNEVIKDYLLPNNTQVVIGEIITDPQQMRNIFYDLVNRAEKTGVQINNIIVFTIGSKLIEETAIEIVNECKKKFDKFTGMEVFYFEGIFNTPDINAKVNLKEGVSYLIRKDALMAPEYLTSQYELPYYPLEYSVMYDASTRSDNIPEYIKEITQYWEKVREMAMKGYDFESFLEECFPKIDKTKFGKQNLMSLAEQHISKLNRLLQPKESIIEN